jgi:lipoyl-dependent peroxiredoxin
MAIQPLYTTTASASGGREGKAGTDDGNLAVTLVMPKELGGAGGDGTNPEQLFATGYAACFHSAVKMVAGMAKVKLPDGAKTTAEIGIGKREDGSGFGLTAALTVTLPGLEDDVADDLIAKAHAACPYSAAIKGNVDVTVTRA